MTRGRTTVAPKSNRSWQGPKKGNEKKKRGDDNSQKLGLSDQNQLDKIRTPKRSSEQGELGRGRPCTISSSRRPLVQSNVSTKTPKKKKKKKKKEKKKKKSGVGEGTSVLNWSLIAARVRVSRVMSGWGANTQG